MCDVTTVHTFSRTWSFGGFSSVGHLFGVAVGLEIGGHGSLTAWTRVRHAAVDCRFISCAQLRCEGRLVKFWVLLVAVLSWTAVRWTTRCSNSWRWQRGWGREVRDAAARWPNSTSKRSWVERLTYCFVLCQAIRKLVSFAYILFYDIYTCYQFAIMLGGASDGAAFLVGLQDHTILYSGRQACRFAAAAAAA